MHESLSTLTARQSEVGDLGNVARPVVHEDYVRRLQVAHDDVAGVAVGKALGDIGDAAGRTAGEERRGKGSYEQARAPQVRRYFDASKHSWYIESGARTLVASAALVCAANDSSSETRDAIVGREWVASRGQ